MMLRKYGLPLLLTLASPAALAHHGVAGVGAAALEGPGATVEAATSSLLPEGKTLLYAKLDHARYKTYDPDPANPESDYANYWMVGLGHGFTSWFSGYVFAPYHAKIDEPSGLDSKGWADISVIGQIGFKHEYGEGLKLVPANESLDDMEDWHFTVFFGGTLPTGGANHRLDDGSIDPGKSTGFGEPSLTLGVTATRMLTSDLTLNVEASVIRFQEYTYDNGDSVQFGDEDRLNLSLTQKLYTNPDSRFRIDGIIEAQHLSLGRDIENGVGAAATGGKILYLVPGVRIYKDNMSFAFGIKKPVSTDLNESSQQQGAEGKEDYRLILNGSLLF